MKVGRLLYELVVLRWWKDVRRAGDFPCALFTTFRILFGIGQGMQCAVVQQHEPVKPCLGAFLHLAEGNRSANVGGAGDLIHGIPAQGQGFR